MGWESDILFFFLSSSFLFQSLYKSVSDTMASVYMRLLISIMQDCLTSLLQQSDSPNWRLMMAESKLRNFFLRTRTYSYTTLELP